MCPAVGKGAGSDENGQTMHEAGLSAPCKSEFRCTRGRASPDRTEAATSDRRRKRAKEKVFVCWLLLAYNRWMPGAGGARSRTKRSMR